MPLHLDHRPQTWDEIAGKDNLDNARRLSKLLASSPEEVPHSYLFCGPPGCGKTTLARITARELGCSDGDYIEMDSAQFRGIETVRSLRQHAQLAPSTGPCRVWLIDECHRLTTDAQEGLLKLLEDTPKHVFLLLATTEPEMLKETLRSRCHRFDVFRLNIYEMIKFLKKAIRREGQDVPKNVLSIIAKSAYGSPRKGLIGLEQVLSVPEEEYLKAAKSIGTEGIESEIRELCQGLIKGKGWKAISEVLSKLENKEDAEKVRRAVLGYAHRVLVGGDSYEAYITLESFQRPTWDMGGWPAITFSCYKVFVEIGTTGEKKRRRKVNEKEETN